MFQLSKVRSIAFVLMVGAFFAASAATPVRAAAAGSEAARPVRKYHCPMHPQVVSDRPGECPICHMRLVPIEAGGEPGSGPAIDGLVAVKIGENAAAAAGIRTEAVEKRPLHRTIHGWGVVAHDPELYKMQIEFLRQERVTFERERSKVLVSQRRGLSEKEEISLDFMHRGLSHEWVEALEKAGEPDTRLVYHHSGQGAWIYVQIREEDLPRVKSGAKVYLTLTGVPGLMIEGTVEFIDTLVDPEKRTVRVHVLIAREPEELRPNALLSATLEEDLGTVLAVPEDGPLFTGGRAVVFVEKDGTFAPREVMLGRRASGYYEVKDGLREGEKVAAEGNFMIDSESRLRASFSGEATGHEGHGHEGSAS